MRFSVFRGTLNGACEAFGDDFRSWGSMMCDALMFTFRGDIEQSTKISMLSHCLLNNAQDNMQIIGCNSLRKRWICTKLHMELQNTWIQCECECAFLCLCRFQRVKRGKLHITYLHCFAFYSANWQTNKNESAPTLDPDLKFRKCYKVTQLLLIYFFDVKHFPSPVTPLSVASLSVLFIF